jgi:hypothetical protein
MWVPSRRPSIGRGRVTAGLAVFLVFSAMSCGGSAGSSAGADSRQARQASRLWTAGVRWDPAIARCRRTRVGRSRAIWQTAIDVARDETDRRPTAVLVGIRDMSNSTSLRSLAVSVVDDRGKVSSAKVDLTHVSDLRHRAVPFSDAHWPSDFEPSRATRSGRHTVYWTSSTGVLVACSGFAL